MLQSLADHNLKGESANPIVAIDITDGKQAVWLLATSRMTTSVIAFGKKGEKVSKSTLKDQGVDEVSGGFLVTDGVKAAFGVKVESDLPADTPAVLISAEQRDGPAYRVGFHNFYVITRYNHSARYAMTVHDLASALAARVHATAQR